MVGTVAEADVVQLILPPDVMRILFECEPIADEVCFLCTRCARIARTSNA